MHMNWMNHFWHSIDEVPVFRCSDPRIVASSTSTELIMPIKKESEPFIMEKRSHPDGTKALSRIDYGAIFIFFLAGLVDRGEVVEFGSDGYVFDMIPEKSIEVILFFAGNRG